MSAQTGVSGSIDNRLCESVVIGVGESAACVEVAPTWNDDDEPPASEIRWCIKIVEWGSVPCRKLGQSVAHSDAWFTELSPDYHRTRQAYALRVTASPDCSGSAVRILGKGPFFKEKGQIFGVGEGGGGGGEEEEKEEKRREKGGGWRRGTCNLQRFNHPRQQTSIINIRVSSSDHPPPS